MFLHEFMIPFHSIVVISPFRSRSSPKTLSSLPHILNLPNPPPQKKKKKKFSCRLLHHIDIYIEESMFYSTDWCAFIPFSIYLDVFLLIWFSFIPFVLSSFWGDLFFRVWIFIFLKMFSLLPGCFLILRLCFLHFQISFFLLFLLSFLFVLFSLLCWGIWKEREFLHRT